MKKFNFAATAENKFKVVRYFPTLDMVKKDLFNMHNNNWGYCDRLRSIIEEDFEGRDLNHLLQEDITTFNILNRLTEHSFTDFNHHYALQNIQTGELINRFYKDIFSYHPDQGYVLFEQESERDFWTGGADPMFRLVSLKSGKEFDGYFVDTKFTSGIYNFEFVSYNPNDLAHFKINPITEELEMYPQIPPNSEEELVEQEEEECEVEDEEPSNGSRPTGHSKLAHFYYNIEWVDFGLPYFETELFKEQLSSNAEFKRIYPFKY
jgi:hypothetical protein